MQDEPAALTTLLSSAICDASAPHNLKDVLQSVQSDRLQDDLVGFYDHQALDILTVFVGCSPSHPSSASLFSRWDRRPIDLDSPPLQCKRGHNSYTGSH